MKCRKPIKNETYFEHEENCEGERLSLPKMKASFENYIKRHKNKPVSPGTEMEIEYDYSSHKVPVKSRRGKKIEGDEISISS